jgi:flagella basal body P-ring formation protein FlgA
MNFSDIWPKTELTLKIVLFTLALSLSVCILIVGAQKATAANLKEISIIDRDTLKLGDLFDGLKHNADYVIGPAPQPGQEMVLNARTLYRIASAMDLDWRPTTSAEQITVRRAATIIPESKIQDALRDALTQEGVMGSFDIKVSGAKDIILPDSLPQTLAVSDIRFNPQNDYFEANLVAPSLEKPIRKISVMGQIERKISVPVLKTTLQNGDVIGAGDIDMMEMPLVQVGKDVILKSETLVGMTPRRIAYGGKPLSDHDMEHPQIVGRGQTVTLIFNDGPLVLTTKGKALHGGAKGDLVQVTNLNSSKSVDGIITGAQEVTVR